MLFLSQLPLLLLLASSTTAHPNPFRVTKGCTAVAPDQCSAKSACLDCGTASTFDCLKCCKGCTLVKKPPYQYCACKKPGPPPLPSGGPDTWNSYTVSGMNVISVTGGNATSTPPYSKVVVMLHGGGGQGSDYIYNYNAGWFGSLTGFKYVFPTSPDHLWYRSYKTPGCGLLEDCAYNLSSIATSAERVSALLDHEKELVGGDASNVYLAGFSEGAQMAGYVQLCKLNYALGGVVVMDGFPLPPLENMPGSSSIAAKKNATYYGQDMKWMLYHGDEDPIFPVALTMSTWGGIFDALEIDATLKINHTEPGMTHTLIEKEFHTLTSFVRGEYDDGLVKD